MFYTINEFKKELKYFASKSNPSLSWVRFTEASLSQGTERVKVLIPRWTSKPNSLLLWIGRHLGWYSKEGTIKKLNKLQETVVSALSLCDEGTDASEKISLVISVATQAGVVASTIFPERPPFLNDKCLAKAIETFHNQEEQRNARRIRQEKETQAQQKFLEDLQTLCRTSSLGPKHKEVAFAINYDDANDPLFDLSYLVSLTQDISHPEIDTDKNKKNKLIEIINKILQRETLEPMSKQNTDRIRQMMCVIFNTLNKQRQNQDFQTRYDTVVAEICEIFGNCSNRLNTGLENLVMTLCVPEGSFTQRVRHALQMHRRQIFQAAISDCITRSNCKSYRYHEASTVNYYFRLMSEEFGLPLSASAMDNNYASYALKDQEEKIRDYFARHYTPVAILKYVHDVINNPLDPAIPCQAFTEWVLDQSYDQEKLLDDEGRYKLEYVVPLLQELEIITPASAPLDPALQPIPSPSAHA